MGLHITGSTNDQARHWRASWPLLCIIKTGWVQRSHQIHSRISGTRAKRAKTLRGPSEALYCKGTRPDVMRAETRQGTGKKGKNSFRVQCAASPKYRPLTMIQRSHQIYSRISGARAKRAKTLRDPSEALYCKEKRPDVMRAKTRHSKGKKGQKLILNGQGNLWCDVVKVPSLDYTLQHLPSGLWYLRKGEKYQSTKLSPVDIDGTLSISSLSLKNLIIELQLIECMTVPWRMNFPNTYCNEMAISVLPNNDLSSFNSSRSAWEVKLN